jgi:hypothetical protein
MRMVFGSSACCGGLAYFWRETPLSPPSPVEFKKGYSWFIFSSGT